MNKAHAGIRLNRRSLVQAASVAGLGGLVGQQSAASQASPGGLRYAVIGDSHIMIGDESSTVFTHRVFTYLESLDPEPAFIFHVGDLTEAGFQVEHESYAGLIPERFRDRTFHVPGNREVQWDEFGLRTFVQAYGQAPFSFDVGGVHFVGLDATILLQTLGRFGHDQLEWLAADLAAVGPEMPTVLFFHYPVGGSAYFVTDQDDLYATIEPYNVVAVHAGHIHRETLRFVNGFIQATMNAVKNGAYIHLVDHVGDALALTSIELEATGNALAQELVTIPLRKAERFAAANAEPVIQPSDVDGVVWVSLPAALAPGAVEMNVRSWPNHLFSERDSDRVGWIPLAPDNPAAPSAWNGAIPLDNLHPGHDRIEMSASEGDWLWQRSFDIAIGLANRPAILWEQPVASHAIHGGLVGLPGGEVAMVTSGGEVAAWAISREGPSEVWRLPGDDLRNGVIGTPAVTADGLLVIGRVSGVADALRATDGATLWTAPLEMPVLAGIASVMADDGEMVLVSTGGTIHALDAGTGEIRWATGSRMLTGGQPAAGGGAIFASFADGTLRAFTVGGGLELWQVATFTSPDIYSLIARSGWAHSTGLVPGTADLPARVITASEKAATGHDANTGSVAWSLEGPYMYARPLLLDSGAVVLGAVDGTVSCIDPVSGAVLWQAALGYGIMNAAPLQYHDKVLVPGVGAQLAILDAATGAEIDRLQLGGTALFSTPIIVGDLLVAGGEDGRLRAVDLSML